MVTTRGRRTSSLVEEPLIDSPRKKKAKKELQPEAIRDDWADENAGSRLRKRRSGATDTLSSSISRSPETKRIKTEPISLSPELRKVSSTPSPSAKRKRNGQAVYLLEEQPEEHLTQTMQVDKKVDEVPEEDSTTEDVAMEVDAPQSTLPSPILSRQSSPEKLTLSKQFGYLLAQSPTRDLELHQQQSIVNQIVQWWEASGQHTSEVKPDSTVINVSAELRNAAIPVLLNVSAQVLHIFAYHSVSDVQRAVVETESEEGKIFGIYQNLFRIVKNLYPTKDGFILQSSQFHELPESFEAFNTANFATFVSSCFGVKDVGFYHLHKHFFQVFTQTESTAIQSQLRLYLELKTQACLVAISNRERSKTLVLAEMFAKDMKPTILAYRPGVEDLLSNAEGFLSKSETRHLALEQLDDDGTSIATFKKQYAYADLLHRLGEYARTFFEDITGHTLLTIAPMCDTNNKMQPISAESASREKSALADAHDIQHTANANGTSHRTTSPPEDPDSSQMQHLNYAHPDPPDPPPPPEPEHATVTTPPPSVAMPNAEDIIAQAARAAQEALLGYSNSHTANPPSTYNHSPYDTSSATNLDQTPSQIRSAQQSSQEKPVTMIASDMPSANKNEAPVHQSPYLQTQETNVVTKQAPLTNDSPYLQKHQSSSQPSYYQSTSTSAYGPPGQSQPTAVLYERARQVANSKSSNVSRNKVSNVSQRRPWTLEEEQALMDGLDQVKGPHWSQILVLYGPGGSVNETLRDRTQVQLKDKARNLKLFFLKSKIEVPYYLSFVTGELKSRAPSHVSAFDDTPPRSIGQPNGLHGSTMSTPTSRNRIIPPVSMVGNPSLFNPIMHLSQSNGTYSSPYAALPGSQPPALTNGTDNVESSENDETNQQNVADLADSAAAQVAAALANFNALDLPNFDMPTSDEPSGDTIEATDSIFGAPSHHRMGNGTDGSETQADDDRMVIDSNRDLDAQPHQSGDAGGSVATNLDGMASVVG